MVSRLGLFTASLVWRKEMKTPTHHKCQCCGWVILDEAYMMAAYDYDCPKCGVYKLSEFESVYLEEESSGVCNAIQDR